MANNKSAKKRIEINKRNRLRNKYYKTSVRTLIKLFFVNLQTYKASQSVDDKKKVQELLSSVYSIMDKGTKKSVFPRNTAARKKAKLASYLKLA
jgi:small subunit ribosomal protein S20